MLDAACPFWQSAGVGRTGTLVALDSLVMELDEEGQASIFNIICDLRHQRNFLVQSLVSHTGALEVMLGLVKAGQVKIAELNLVETHTN